MAKISEYPNGLSNTQIATDNKPHFVYRSIQDLMKNALVGFTLLMMGIISTAHAQQICYSIADYENKVYKFNQSTGSVIDSKSLSSLSSPEASTLNLAGDTLWILNADELHYIPVSTTLSNYKISGSNISSQQISGSSGNMYCSDFDAMSVDKNGDIWAGSSSNNPCILVVLDRSTGNVKEDYFGSGVDYLVVDNSAYTSLRFDAMAFDPLTNELYDNMNGLSQNYDYLFKINTTNGAMTLVRQFSEMSDVEGMGFDASGDLLVTTGANATNGSHDNKLWKIDLTTGVASEMFGVGGSDVETCDCVIGDPIPTVEISGTVFFDTNKDSTYTSVDHENTGITISLIRDVNTNGTYESGTDTVVTTTTTHADGSYYFRVEYGSGSERYLVQVDTSDLPDGATLNSDDILAVTVSNGEVSVENNNFGFESDILNAFSGFAYGDSDNDATFDSWEPLIAGVQVLLYEDNDCDGVIDSNDDILDSTIVGSDGKYIFLQNFDNQQSNMCYITAVDVSTLPTGSSLTTDNIETANFTSGGTEDANNNFGIWGGAIAALPVEWLYFDGRIVEQGIQLDWGTASEENNSHFVVQRSSENDVWEDLYEIAGAGNSVEVSQYTFTDNNPKIGANYYRIKQVDFDGQFEYSKVIMFDQRTGGDLGLNFYPNPAQNDLMINWEGRSPNSSVQLLDMSGKVLEQKDYAGSNNAYLSLNSYPNGIYFIRLETNTSVQTKKLVVKN